MARQQITIELVDKVSRALGNVERSLKKLDNNNAQVARGFGNLKAAAGAFIGALAVREVIQFGNQMLDAAGTMEQYRNQLRLVTGSQQELENTMDELNALAIANRASFGDTVDLYGKLKLATDNLGVSNEQVTSVMSNFQKALALSGADANTASGAIRQFGQAMASGTVRGDEFNSIVEALGPALNIMARETGITVGELRQMSQAGELTAEAFFDMLEGSQAISAAFNTTQKTIADLEQEVSDAAGKMLAKFADESGLTNLYKSILDDLARSMRAVAGAATDIESASLKELVDEKALGSASERLKEFNHDTKEVMRLLNALEAMDAGDTWDLLGLRVRGHNQTLERTLEILGITLDEYKELRSELEKQIAAQNRLREEGEYLNRIDQERQQVIDGVLSKYDDLTAITTRLTRANEAALDPQEKLRREHEQVTKLIEKLKTDMAVYGSTVSELAPALAAAETRQEQLNEAIAEGSKTTNEAVVTLDSYYKKLLERAQTSIQTTNFEVDIRNRLLDKQRQGITLSEEELKILNDLTPAKERNTRATRDFGKTLEGLESKYMSYLRNSQGAMRRAANEEIKLLQEVAAKRPELAKRAAEVELAIEQSLTASILEEQKKRQAAAQAYYNKNLQLFEKGKFAELDLTKMTEDQKLSFVKDAGRSALGALATQNRKAFELNKALMIAEAVINVATGVTKALAQGGIFGPLLAGAIIAAGAVQIATIRNTKYQGYAQGGEMTVNRPAVVGENGPEIVVPKNPSVVMPNSVKERLDAGGGKGPVTVNFNITTLDARDFDSMLIERRATITGIINDAMVRRGKVGVY